jgi:hypothetical protein
MNKGTHMGKEMINHKLPIHFCVFAVSISMLLLQVHQDTLGGPMVPFCLLGD